MYLELKQENSAALEGCAFYMPKREEECVLCHKWCQEICKKTHGAEEEKHNKILCFVFDRYIKNMIIGSNKQKETIIQQGITPRLIQLLDDPLGGDELKLEGTRVNMTETELFLISFSLL